MRELISVTMNEILVEISQSETEDFSVRIISKMREALPATVLTRDELRVLRIAVRATLEDKSFAKSANGDFE